MPDIARPGVSLETVQGGFGDLDWPPIFGGESIDKMLDQGRDVFGVIA